MGTAIVNQLINTTNVVQTVTYNFRYRLNDPRNGGIPFCDHGVDTTITVYVNPTPRFTVEIADTIVCDSTTITLELPIYWAMLGDKVYDLTTTYTPGAIPGVQAVRRSVRNEEVLSATSLSTLPTRYRR